jgi:hypothetical protein
VSKRDIKPVIHVSKPEGESAGAGIASRPAASAGTPPPRTKTLSPRPSLQKLRQERRRFHLSRSALSTSTSTNSDVPATGVPKRRSTSPAVFVERGRKKLIRKALQNATQQAQEKAPSPEPRTQAVAPAPPPAPEGTKEVFKRPGTKRVKPRSEDAPAQRAPLPSSSARPHTEDLDKLAAEMNQWVLDEIGANLKQMEAEKKKTQTQTQTTTTSRFRPKAPPQRYTERHPETLQPPVTDAAMSDVTDEEGDDDDGDWVIDEYVRVPAKSMAVDISPAEVGVLVLDGEDDDIQFFGDDYDEDDEYLEDDEDENGKRWQLNSSLSLRPSN